MVHQTKEAEMLATIVRSRHPRLTQQTKDMSHTIKLGQSNNSLVKYA